MAIQVLPPQLANQIAAGEVVERPASVVKELVENSLDAGATRVDIEIERGGNKLIRIRDNGAGIPKDELALALARHATSKVQTLDDLEAILSFGFRGEALASISSVSRLTLTSRTADQAEAWQAYAEGSEMAIRVIPAAHPVGTSIEIADLFFNTPARRRFLKSDKTEFTHIDEWLKRVALARPKVHFSLNHNGKLVRQYRPASGGGDTQRLAQVAGRAYADSAIRVDCHHDGLHLQGYLQSPLLAEVVDCQYFYVNGRLVRDRLVNHAVRQAFAASGALEQPGFVLQLSLDPHQVDVNVHPAKHEVRFHQARYVHDFILQALLSALSQIPALSMAANQQEVGNRQEVSMMALHNSADSAVPEINNAHSVADIDGADYPVAQHNSYSDQRYTSAAQGRGYVREHFTGQNVQTAKHYANLLQTSASYSQGSPALASSDSGASPASMPALLDGRFWVLCEDSVLRLLSLDEVARALLKRRLVAKLATGLIGQPLLMPVSLAADPGWESLLVVREPLLRRLGLELTIRYGQLIIKQVPAELRDTKLAQLIPELLAWITPEIPSDEALSQWLALQPGRFEAAPLVWQGLQALADAERNRIIESARVLPWQAWLNEH